MADQKISELTALTGANVADDDAIAIVDTSATETKKIVFSELKNALDTATGFVRITGDTMTGALNVQSTITSDGLTLSGGVYLGGTGSANKLDDYEEGTWTPTMAGYSGVTYSTRVGYYTRVGRMVMANFEMNITSIGTYTSNSHIGGFPFSAGISNTAACGVQLTVMTALNETRNEHYGALYNGGSGFFIYNRNGGARNGNVHQAGKYAGTLIYTTA